MTAREFLIEWFEIEPERYEQEGNVSIAEMVYDEISSGNIDELLEIMESYAQEYSNSTGRRMEE